MSTNTVVSRGPGAQVQQELPALPPSAQPKITKYRNDPYSREGKVHVSVVGNCDIYPLTQADPAGWIHENCGPVPDTFVEVFVGQNFSKYRNARPSLAILAKLAGVRMYVPKALPRRDPTNKVFVDSFEALDRLVAFHKRVIACTVEPSALTANDDCTSPQSGFCLLVADPGMPGGDRLREEMSTFKRDTTLPGVPRSAMTIEPANPSCKKVRSITSPGYGSDGEETTSSNGASETASSE